MKNLSEFVRSEAAKLRKQWPDLNLTTEQAKTIVRWSMNRYVGRANFDEVLNEQDDK